ncbi:TetR/AcrR family transcriptional regulator [Auraticoccus monumenti]|uniref:DNA-binding transcriptional regulator, AcrR family n=1 Tax=Auraticoccus monumenti TaxID=675864 RepID=A0A1G7BSK4_9ACTN|nr:TetR/AcrR family transcriptional regulator [Auraticoccus monumenti]SDE30088.1 DNA-binding transcriptional regulator, AcrR family [Auraticoccus monumenti]
MVTSERGRIGRPREFDVDEALDDAMQVFWEKGYEGASLAELTAAMGITKPSMYAAFGNKEQLFRRAVERYTAGPASYGYRALEEPTAQEVTHALLHGAARATTLTERPSGCMGVQSALVTGDAGSPARSMLVDWRNDVLTRLRERFRRAAAEGDLPPTLDPDRFATYVMTVAYGIAVQAATGLSGEDLHGVADSVVAAVAWADDDT